MNPVHVVPAISVQAEWNKSLGIIRGARDGNYLVEDHIREKLSCDGYVIDSGTQIIGADKMRKQVWSVDKHLQHFMLSHPSQMIQAWVGNGNLLSNPHVVGFANGHRFYLKSEEREFGNREYSSLVVRKRNNKTYAVSIEKLCYDCSSISPHSISYQDAPGEIEYAAFGQHIVRDGRSINKEELVEMAMAQQFYDLRHLFLFGRLSIGENRWLDIGLGAFWTAEGEMDIERVKDAILGSTVSFDISAFEAKMENLHSAMSAKSYKQVLIPENPGDYSICSGEMRIIFLEGIYPHNMLGIRKDGSVISVVIKGLSNRLGVTIFGAADIMLKLGAENALILDNGGDVIWKRSDLGLQRRRKKQTEIYLPVSPGFRHCLPGTG